MSSQLLNRRQDDPVEPLRLSDFDRANVGRLIGGHGDWFSAYLIRLVKRADFENRQRLRAAYPEHVMAVEAWELERSDHDFSRRELAEDQGAVLDLERPDRFDVI